MKRNIVPISAYVKQTDSSVIDLLRPVSYEMIDDVTGRTRFGFIAQELATVLPSLVLSTDSDDADGGTLTVMYQDIIAILTMAIQEQKVSFYYLIQLYF